MNNQSLFEATPLEGAWIFNPKIFEDQRGYFFESFNARSFKESTGIEAYFVQDNQSQSNKGTLRGLHFQKGNDAQAKLVRVLKGEVFDVAVDLRPTSSSFGQWYGVKLTEANKKQFFIPRGMAHGYLVLSDKAEFFYKCDQFYNPQAEGGLMYNDPDINISWPEVGVEYILSAKDQLNSSWIELKEQINKGLII